MEASDESWGCEVKLAWNLNSLQSRSKRVWSRRPAQAPRRDPQHLSIGHTFAKDRLCSLPHFFVKRSVGNYFGTVA